MLRSLVSTLFLLIGITATAFGQAVVTPDTDQKIPAKNDITSQKTATTLGAGDPVSVQGQIAKSDMTVTVGQVTAVTPISLTKVPMLLLAEDAKLPQGQLGNIAIVNKDMLLETSIKAINSSMPIGRVYRPAGESEAKAIFEKYQVQIQKSFDQIGADRKYLTAIAVSWTEAAPVPDKVASTTSAPATTVAKTSSGGN